MLLTNQHHPGRTPRSIKEHIAKLRKEAKQVAAPATLPDGFQLPPPQARAPRTTKEKPNGAAKGNGNGQGTKPGRGGGGGRSGKRKHSETITEANGEVDGVDDEEAESGGKRFKVEVTEDDGANDELEAA